ncbi:MAG TPA: SH3 domain-containing protein [Bacteroidetes bacterium]|nr:SH3 domain-containing protein [Bacteroidota bacterium]
MKTTLLGFLLLFPLLLLAQKPQYLSYEIGKSSELLADHVNVRSGPDRSENVIATLPIGTSVVVLDDFEASTIRGIEAPWLKVRFEDGNKLQEGFLWAGMLATTSFASKTDPKLRFYFGLSHSKEADWFPQLYLQIRAVRAGKQIAKLEFEGVGDLQPGAYWHAYDGLGIPGIQDIFNLGFAAGYCAGPAGDAYIFWDGKQFFHAKTIYSGSDAPVFLEEMLIFPNNEDGRKEKIILKHKSGEHADNEAGEILDEYWEETYIWTGKKLKKISK